MRRALIGLILTWLCSVPVSQAQQPFQRDLSLASLRLHLPKMAPAVEIGGAIEGDQIETVEGPRQTKKQWFLGAYWRHIWMPEIFQDIFADEAPSVSTGLLDFGDSLDPNVGLLATYRNEDGFSIIFGLGYTSYEFEGAYRPNDDEFQNTEWVKSDLEMWHGTFAVLWSTALGDVVALEYGLGIDLGLIFGDITRWEAYWDRGDKEWRPCERAGVPATETDGRPYCEEPSDPDLDSDPSNEMGAHYNVKVGRWSDDGDIPNIVPIPMIPQVALRIAPVEEFVIKLEAGYGIMEFWAGLSVHGAIWTAPRAAALPPELRVVKRPDELPPAPLTGRVNGLVVEQGTQTPVSNAAVAVAGRPEIEPIQTLDDGTFLSEAFEPGQVVFEISHPDYQTSSCTAVISQQGGDANQVCPIVALPRVGKIDGRVLGPRGPLAEARVEISGPLNQTFVSDEWGSFSYDQAPAGTYLARVTKEGFIDRSKQFTVEVRETARVEITLTEKPKLTMVTVEKEEIKISQQIHFATASAKIKASSFPLMNEIASVFKSYAEIKLVEIQGHTDDRGSDSYNLGLSQRRADSVRAWLVSAGVEPERLESKGYGESLPLESNRTKAGRARNRRVQFIIKQREEEPR
ncbi:MAG: OmpA family protein [Deltaproteobacteria bacterium]|nr:OmpA family protein [Deltaproteobacteria bacterium]